MTSLSRAIAVAREGKAARASLFVSEYVLDFKASAAYRRAFPHLCERLSAETIGARAHAMLRDPWIAEEIERRRRETILPAHVTRDRVLHELARIAFADPRKMDGKTLTALDDDAAAVVKAWKVNALGDVEIKLHDKLAALQTLARVTGAIPDTAARTVAETGAAFDTLDEVEILEIIDAQADETGTADVVDMDMPAEVDDLDEDAL